MRFNVRSNVLTRGLCMLLCALAPILSACGTAFSQPGDHHSSGGQALQITLHADRAVIGKPTDLCNPPLTAEVIVGAHGTARWNTSDGKRPAITTIQEAMQKNYYIYRTVAFARFTALHEHRTVAVGGPATTFVTIGGQVGQDSYRIDELPQLQQVNGHYIVVITPPTTTAGLPTRDSLLVSYDFPVDAQGMVTLRRASSPNEPGIGQVDTGLAISLADLQQVLASCTS